ncbi:MAG: transposase [Planctomycetaceae bacterium]|nr:transposase [Planctomycetaceae bacterium]
MPFIISGREIIASLIPPTKPGGRPRTPDMHEILNSLLYQNRIGCQWEMLSRDLFPNCMVREDYSQWVKGGIWGVGC